MQKNKLLFRIATLILAALLLLGLLASGFSVSAAPFRPGGSGGQDGPGNGSTTGNASVDHIDIGVDLSATIIVDGVPEVIDFKITTNDAQYVTIEAEPAGTAFSANGGVTTSTDNSGKKQIRIEGTFPVGTKSDPVYYTVTLSKTIETDSGTKIPVTLYSTMQYWDSGNICPGYAETPRSMSGIDLTLGEGSTKGSLFIQKTLNGLTSEHENTFHFALLGPHHEIYMEDISVVVPAGQTTASIFLTNLDLGTYSIEEINPAGQIDGYDLVNVEYTNQGVITLSANEPTAAVNVTNYYETPSPTTGNITFTISVEDAHVTKDTIYYLNVYDEDDSLVMENQAIMVAAGTSAGTVAVQELPFGTYRLTVNEALTKLDGYTLSNVFYSSMGLVTLTADNTEACGSATFRYAKPAMNVESSNEWHFVLPEKINGAPFTTIKANAFRGLNKLTTVTIPNSVTEIGDNAFADCPNLTTITFLGRANTSGITLGNNWSGVATLAFTETEAEETTPPPAEPEETTPPATEPEITTPPSTEPEEPTPPATEPETTTPPPTEPEETIPPTTVPEITAPPPTEPEETVPPTTVPEITTPPPTEPEETVPPTTVPEITTPPSTEPEEIVPPFTIAPAMPPSPTTTPEPTAPPTTTPETMIPTDSVPVTETPSKPAPESDGAKNPKTKDSLWILISEVSLILSLLLIWAIWNHIQRISLEERYAAWNHEFKQNNSLEE